MNRKSICRHLKKVHSDWADSIEDDNIRAMVNEHTIITGGAIASMLLGEKVNDYDVYFDNFETTKAVAEYYIKQFIELNPKTRIRPKLHAKAFTEEKRVKIYVKSIGFCSEKSDQNYQYFENLPDDAGDTFIDDRANPNEDAMDYDPVSEDDEDIDGDGLDPELMGPTLQDTYKNVIEAADDVPASGLERESTGPETTSEAKLAERPPYRPIFMTSNAITLSGGVQIVVRFYGSPDEIHTNYDFTHCTNYWTSKDGKLTLRPDAMECLLSRDLQYQGSKYPICSIIRTRKFLRRGWHINAGQYLKMCFQVSELDLKDMNVLEDQLTGVDTAYFHQLIERCKRDLKHNPNMNIDSIYIVSLVDHMF